MKSIRERNAQKHPETAQQRNYGLRAIVLQTPSFSCAAPDENGYVVTCLHLRKQILVSNSFVFCLVFYFISGYFSLLRLKPYLVPISSRQEKIMSHCSPLLLAQVLAVLYETIQIKSNLYGHLLHLFSVQCLMNFFLFQFYYYSLKEDNAIQVSLKPELFRYKNANYLQVYSVYNILVVDCNINVQFFNPTKVF